MSLNRFLKAHMKFRRLTFILSLLFASIMPISCKCDSELDEISEKHSYLTDYVNSLKNDDTLVYIKCNKCGLPSLNNGNIIGYTDRVRPTGNYFRKDLKIGDFKSDVYFVYERKIYKNDKENSNVYKSIYFCYFDEKQKEKFDQFSHYYDNMISHGKKIIDIQYINSTAVITIQSAGYGY